MLRRTSAFLGRSVLTGTRFGFAVLGLVDLGFAALRGVFAPALVLALTRAFVLAVRLAALAGRLADLVLVRGLARGLVVAFFFAAGLRFAGAFWALVFALAAGLAALRRLMDLDGLVFDLVDLRGAMTIFSDGDEVRGKLMKRRGGGKRPCVAGIGPLEGCDLGAQYIRSSDALVRRAGLARALYDWVLRHAAAPYAFWFLGAIAFAESSFFPIPPDVMVVCYAF